MASSLDFVEYVCEQISGAGGITYRKMFGEYGIYCEGKIIGLICDNQFFVKKTIVGADLLPSAEEAPPYTSAKPHFVIEALDDKEFLAEFIRKTCDELPMPKPKKKKQV
ncbi:MAG: competence protein TfoX [Firmicutes bacterium HGW-Firmicutes-7]|nr:MAG: competence protein TfoX [Firmicutes bacterium HGW-Firmicutes-7]